MVSVSKRNFTRGIFSPEVQSRKDVPAWEAGANRLENVLIMKHGGVRKRPGTIFVYKLPADDQNTRMLPFTFSPGQSYAMLMGNGSMKPITQGGMVVRESFGITAITQANPAVVTAPFHALESGKEVFLSGIEGMTELNGRVVTVTVIDADNFSINVDSTGFSAFTGDDGTVRTGAPDPDPVDPPVQDPTPTPTPAPTIPPGGGGGDGNFIPPDDFDPDYGDYR